MARSKKFSNVKLAGLFVLFVFGLIALSLLIKGILIIRTSKFDGKHEFNLAGVSKSSTDLISLSPPTRSILILSMDRVVNKDQVIKSLEVPMDAQVALESPITQNNVSSSLFKLILPFGSSFKDMTYVDAVRLFLFSRSVPPSSIYYRKFSDEFNQAQKSTLISLTFTDPTIYKENQSIEIINATNTYGLGGRLADLISNIGGNVILVTSPQATSEKSKIIYFGEKTYTVERLSKILDYPISKTDKKSIADVIIVIGNDSLEKNKF